MISNMAMSIQTTKSVRMTAGVARYWAPSQKKIQSLDEQQHKEKLLYIVVGETTSWPTLWPVLSLSSWHCWYNEFDVRSLLLVSPLQPYRDYTSIIFRRNETKCAVCSIKSAPKLKTLIQFYPRLRLWNLMPRATFLYCEVPPTRRQMKIIK